jgi:hypothetical protein
MRLKGEKDIQAKQVTDPENQVKVLYVNNINAQPTMDTKIILIMDILIGARA